MYKKMHLLLFNRITDALEALRQGDTPRAEALLIRAQQDAEELYLEGTEK